MAMDVLCKLDRRLRGKEVEVNAFLSRHCFLSPEMIEACQDQGAKIESVGLMAKAMGGLITGGPVAPFLFDLILSDLIDRPIEKLMNTYFDGRKGEWCYTRYIDDLTFSFPSHRIQNNPYLRREIRRIIMDAGFGISHHKARLLDIRKGAVQVTGVNLVFGPKGVFAKLSQPYLRETRHFFYLANKPDSSVTLEQVSGVWGAFYACLRRRHTPLSAVEREIVMLYQSFRTQYEAGKCKLKDPDPKWMRQLKKKLAKLTMAAETSRKTHRSEGGSN